MSRDQLQSEVAETAKCGCECCVFERHEVIFRAGLRRSVGNEAGAISMSNWLWCRFPMIKIIVQVQGE